MGNNTHTPRWWIQLLDRQDTVSDDQLNNIQSNFAVQTERLALMIDREIVFRQIASYFSDGLITEPILNSLEKMEELDYRAGMEVLASLKRAYCVVAVYCTTIYLDGSSFKQGKYFEAVDRIWRGRIKGLESRQSELVTDELKRCRDKIEAALYDAYARRSLVDRQTNMFHFVDVYLNEVLTIMGPFFVEVVLTQTAQGSGTGPSVGLSLQSPEINGVRESPRAGSLELRRVVRDSLSQMYCQWLKQSNPKFPTIKCSPLRLME